MNTDNIPYTTSSKSHAQHVWLLDLFFLLSLFFIPNLLMALQVIPLHVPGTSWQRTVVSYQAMPSHFYFAWLMMNGVLLMVLLGVRRYVLQPIARIAQHLSSIRTAFMQETMRPVEARLSMRVIAMDVGRFAGFAMEYYRKHQEVTLELEQARAIIAQFVQQQQTMLSSSGREIGEQYRSVLTYANYLEEQIFANKLDPTLRYDFDDVCESSFNLKLIAEALAMLSVSSPPQAETVPLAALMQQTMLALAPALDRRSMKLTTAEVDMAVAAEGDPHYIAHILWMMMLGMIRYAADESTLRIRCLHSRDGSQALISIVVSELSPLQLSTEERQDFLVRQLQHLTPHMFAETIRIHGNLQLAHLLIQRMCGSITVLPLTVSSCEICMILPSAQITKKCA